MRQRTMQKSLSADRVSGFQIAEFREFAPATLAKTRLAPGGEFSPTMEDSHNTYETHNKALHHLRSQLVRLKLATKVVERTVTKIRITISPPRHRPCHFSHLSYLMM